MPNGISRCPGTRVINMKPEGSLEASGAERSPALELIESVSIFGLA